ncbi:glucokinase, partial [Modicella reniformis]
MTSPSPQSEVITRLTKAFAFPISAYDDLVDQFISELHEGLTQEDRMPMIPTFVYELPTGEETGMVLSIDLGGTNLRVCRTTLSGDGNFEIIHKKWTISDALKKGSGVELFAWIADRIEEFLLFQCHETNREGNYPLGMTFSFPCEQLDINVGKLLNWTKGFRGNDVLGQDVVKVLQDCIDAKNLNITVNALINDTVGTLLATTYKHPGCEIGIIFGTGTNCAYLESQSEVTKIRPDAPNYTSPTDMQVINTEWGAFGNKSGALPANDYDILLDRRSSQPGKQLYEKMVSGLYISELTRLVLHDLALKGDLFVGESSKPRTVEELGNLAVKERFDGAMMGSIEGDDSPDLKAIGTHFLENYRLETTKSDRETIKTTCQLISARAARLSAVGIAALIKKRKLLTQSSKQVIVGIDGSLFNKYPHFRQHLEGALYEIFDIATVKAKVSLINAEDGSGVGGAIAAYLACKQKDCARKPAGSIQTAGADAMTDSTPQPDYYLHLDLAEAGLETQAHTDGGETFLDFSQSGNEETTTQDISEPNIAEQNASQWQTGVKDGLEGSVAVDPVAVGSVAVDPVAVDPVSVGSVSVGPSLESNSAGGFSDMMEEQVTLDTSATHWHGAQQ